MKLRIWGPVVAACLSVSGNSYAKELPSWAKWSDKAAPYNTVAETFLAVRGLTRPGCALTDPVCPSLSPDGKRLSLSNWSEGPLEGFWEFSGGSPETHPTRYFRYTILPGPDWAIEVSWGCDESKDACERFVRDIPDLLPPPPPPPPPLGF